MGLGSLAYPSVPLTVFRTETFFNTAYYPYSVTRFTVVSIPYSTVTNSLYSYYYEPGNFPACDPAAMGCNYGFPNYVYYAYSTSTYSRLSTSFYQAKMATQSTFTSRLTKTGYQNIPMYTALGLNDSQFTILGVFAVLIVLVFGLLLLKQVGELPRFDKPVSACKMCGTNLVQNDRFCGKCGTAIHDSE
jgi:hypothetical protein